MNLSNQIRHGLKSLSITASELSRRSGVPKQTISDWLAGVPPRSIPYLKQIADVFGISVDDLLFGEIPERARPIQSSSQNHQGNAKFPRPERFINSMPDMVGYWDSDLRNLYANSAYEFFFGMKPEDIRGKTMLELLGPELFEKNRRYAEDALRGEIQIFERELRTVSGTLKHMLAKYIPDIINGKVCGFAVIVVDVSDVK